MAGRAHERGAVVELARRRPSARGRRWRRRPSSAAVQRAVGVEGVGIEPAGAAVADGALERVEVRGRVRELELVARGRARGDGRHSARGRPASSSARRWRRAARDDSGCSRGARCARKRSSVQSPVMGCAHSRHGPTGRAETPIYGARFARARRRNIAYAAVSHVGPRVAAVAVAVAYLAMAPRVVNGDGLGYLKAALVGHALPGAPRVRAAARGSSPAEPARRGRWSCCGRRARERARGGAGGVDAVLAGAAALGERRGGVGGDRRIRARRGARCRRAATSSPTRRRWRRSSAPGGAPIGSGRSARGLLCAAAALMHVENLLFVRRVRAPRRRPARARSPSSRSPAQWSRSRYASGAARRTASAGCRARRTACTTRVRWTTPFVAVYGACKALV